MDLPSGSEFTDKSIISPRSAFPFPYNPCNCISYLYGMVSYSGRWSGLLNRREDQDWINCRAQPPLVGQGCSCLNWSLCAEWMAGVGGREAQNCWQELRVTGTKWCRHELTVTDAKPVFRMLWKPCFVSGWGKGTHYTSFQFHPPQTLRRTFSTSRPDLSISCLSKTFRWQDTQSVAISSQSADLTKYFTQCSGSGDIFPLAFSLLESPNAWDD